MPPLIKRSEPVTVQDLLGPGSNFDKVLKEQAARSKEIYLGMKPKRAKREKVKPLLSIRLRTEPCEGCDGLSGGCLQLVICANPACKSRFTREQFNDLWECYDNVCPTCRVAHGQLFVCPACEEPLPTYERAIVCPNDPGGREVIEALAKELRDESLAEVQ